MKWSKKHYFGFVQLLFGIQLGLASVVFDYTSNPFDQYTAVVISALLLVLSVLTFTFTTYASKVYSTVFCSVFVLILLHSISFTYNNPLSALHSINLLLFTTMLIRFWPWKRLEANQLAYTLEIGTLVILGVVFILRRDLVSMDNFSAPLDTFLFSIIGTLEIIIILQIATLFVLNKEGLQVQKLSSRVQFQNDLLSIISHNIRTPLTYIYNKLEIEKLVNKDSDSLFVSELSESVQHLVDIVESTLSNRDILNTTNESKPLAELITKLNYRYGQEIFLSQSNVEPKHTIENYEPVLFGLQKIVDNAIRWSEKEPPTVFIRTKNNSVLAIIADRGPGMSIDVLKLYGSPFISNGANSGKGLGVYFTLGLLSNSGYDILVKTVESKGVTIMIFDNEKNDHSSFKEKGWMYKYFPAYAKDEAVIEDLTDSDVPSGQMAKVANTFSR